MTATSIHPIKRGFRTLNIYTFGRCLAFCGISLLTAFSIADAAPIQDWPQFRGPNRDEISTETNLLESWPEGGPEQVWRSSDGGAGYAGFSVVAGRLYTMGADDEHDFVLCLDANDGSEIWKQAIDSRYNNGWGDGPRSTPTISGDNVFVISALGKVACLSVKDGSIVWTQSLTELGGSVPDWGYCESVLVDGDQVVCTPGGTEGAIVALDVKTGKRKWQSSLFMENAHYSSIIIADHPDKRHYVQLTEKVFVGIDPANGGVLWRQDWPGGRTAVIPAPIYNDNKVYITSGYNAGSTLVDISDLNSPNEIWFNKNMKNHHGGVVRLDGHYYGYSDSVGWICQSEETGEIVWSEKEKLGKGAISYADDRLYLIAEDSGEVVLIDASPEGWKERGRFTPSPLSKNRKPRGKIWVHPVISNGKLYLRDQEMIWCYDIVSP